MTAVLYPLCAAVSLLAMAYRARVLRTDPSAPQLALVANFLLLGIVFAVSTPSLYVAVSSAAGVVNFAGLLAQICVIGMTVCQQVVLLHLRYPAETARRKAGPRVATLGLVVAAMAVLFMTGPGMGEAPETFSLDSARTSPAYLTVYLAAFTANQVQVGAMGWRYARIAPSAWLRRGLRLVAFTLPLALAYTACRTADVIAVRYGGSGHAWEPVAQLSVGLAVLVQTAGWVLPDLGPHVSTAAARLRARAAYRDLAPLHVTLTTAVPEPVLDLGREADLSTRLYRMLIEIRDAQWELRTWMDAEVTGRALEDARRAGLTGEGRAAFVEAAQLLGAIEAQREGRPPDRPADTPVTAAPGDLAAELAFLRRLAKAMDSPAVRSAAGIASGHPS
ncbi:hypothetical protein LG634_25925 [Streptomyces bambusae]|uniref:MAB_1171c family putative transporter n=1 Tax=Streptomyces bambusae TaxID=1550616 RepID=UPI001CFCF39F|nr:MAB_1171c family putative transporter [Streptomyces bambusae]MCB5168256.1 hypothetical protein [Streptomyces bambusae]